MAVRMKIVRREAINANPSVDPVPGREFLPGVATD